MPTMVPVPWPPGEAWSLFAREPAGRVEAARWVQQARTFFRAELSLVEGTGGDQPARAALAVEVAPADAPRAVTRVAIVTVPLADAPEALAAARRGVQAIGGAGFDALLAQAARLWQVGRAVGAAGDPRAALVVAAVLASVLLAPVVPPDEVTAFGVRGARLRLDALGWRT